jgi:hypothetical protein
MGWEKNLIVGVAILVIAAAIGLLINTELSDYAVLDYQLQGPSGFFVTGNNYLDITLKEGDSGNIGVVPTTEISVVNATITGVSIPGVAQFQLNGYCQYNGTLATISNLTAVAGSSLSNWATIQITPNNGAKSFSVSASVTLPTDWLHFKNTSMIHLPTELDYNQTSTNQYTLLQYNNP